MGDGQSLPDLVIRESSSWRKWNVVVLAILMCSAALHFSEYIFEPSKRHWPIGLWEWIDASGLPFGVLAFSVAFLCPWRVVLSEDRFSITNRLISRTYLWREIESFETRSSLGITGVVWRRPGEGQKRRKDWGWFPAYLTVRPEKLCALMQSRLDDYRARHGA